MKGEVLYMLGVIGVGFLANYLLRALPFILFAGRGRALPRGVERFGSVISPVIIAALIVYSYSGLAWKTLWPYLAGVLVVGLQLWKRNPLVSIVAGTVLYMCLLTCGCASRKTLEFNAENPAARVSVQGVFFDGERVEPTDVAKILSDYDVPHDRVVYILLDSDVKDLRPARNLMACLSRAGYTRSVLVTKRHSEAVSTGKGKRTSSSSGTTPTRKTGNRVRYKKASE